MRIEQRRRHRTSDPKQLASHLSDALHEIAEYAGELATEDWARLDNRLGALYHQLSNVTAQVSEARTELAGARQFHEQPEWDVVAADEDIRQPADTAQAEAESK